MLKKIITLTALVFMSFLILSCDMGNKVNKEKKGITLTMEYNKYGDNYQVAGPVVDKSLSYKKGDFLRFEVSGVTDKDVKNMSFLIVDTSEAVDYWLTIASCSINNVKADEKFELTVPIKIENTPLTPSETKIFINSMDVTSNVVISDFKFSIGIYSDITTIKDEDGEASIRNISAKKLVKEMKAGWNLGNTLDPTEATGLAAETYWNEEKTTKEIVHLGMANGYKTIRIPTTWYNHIIDDKYTIDPDWMKRVKTVVDWAIEDGYYVILNEHHSVHDNMNSPLEYGDGYIVRNNKTDIAESKAFLKAVWTQIGTAFNTSYDEHLIFETMNEPRNSSHDHTWQPGLKLSWCDNSTCKECIADYKLLNEYNQLCLDTIRATGGNNADRFVMIPSLCTGEGTALHNQFKMPADTASDKLILTTHNYILGSTEDYIKTKFTSDMKTEIDDTFAKLNDAFISKGIPIVIGETGAFHKTPLTERLKWIKYFTNAAADYGMSVVYWDVGSNNPQNSMAEFDRKNLCIVSGEEAFVEAFVAAFLFPL